MTEPQTFPVKADVPERADHHKVVFSPTAPQRECCLIKSITHYHRIKTAALPVTKV